MWFLVQIMFLLAALGIVWVVYPAHIGNAITLAALGLVAALLKHFKLW